MDAVKCAATIGLLMLATPLTASPASDPIVPWQPYVAEASERFSIPQSWIVAVIGTESRGQTTLAGHPIRSHAGAMGLMQLMPTTWADMRATFNLGTNPDDPHDNIVAGTAYLRLMFDRFGYPGLFAAYDAGPARFADHLAGVRPLPSETVAYLAAVSGQVLNAPAGGKPTPPTGLFFAIGAAHRDIDPAKPTLFVALTSPPAPAQ